MVHQLWTLCSPCWQTRGHRCVSAPYRCTLGKTRLQPVACKNAAHAPALAAAPARPVPEPSEGPGGAACQHIALNKQLCSARAADELLALFDAAPSLSRVNTCTAFFLLSKACLCSLLQLWCDTRDADSDDLRSSS
jgi:hypothetical protein